MTSNPSDNEISVGVGNPASGKVAPPGVGEEAAIPALVGVGVEVLRAIKAWVGVGLASPMGVSVGIGVVVGVGV